MALTKEAISRRIADNQKGLGDRAADKLTADKLTKEAISRLIAKAWTQKGSAAGLREGIRPGDPSITGLTDAVAIGIAAAAIEGVESVTEATSESAGIVELATVAEVEAGVDERRAVTPAGLATGALNPLKSRMTAAEGSLTSLQERVSTAEGDLDAAEARLTTAEGTLASHGMSLSDSARGISTLKQRTLKDGVGISAALSALGIYAVRLDSYGTNRLVVIQAVRTLTSLGLADAKHLVESAPCFILINVDATAAQNAVTALQTAGATATMIGGAASVGCDLSVNGDISASSITATEVAGVSTPTLDVNSGAATIDTLGHITTDDGLSTDSIQPKTAGGRVNVSALSVGAGINVTGEINAFSGMSVVGTVSVGDLEVNGDLTLGEDILGPATDVQSGLVELATYAETAAGTDQTRAVTPYSLTGRTATTARRGLIELATAAEALAGADQARGITPYLLKYFCNNRSPLKGYFICYNLYNITSSAYAKRLNLSLNTNAGPQGGMQCVYDPNSIGSLIFGIGGRKSSTVYYKTEIGFSTDTSYGFYPDYFNGGLSEESFSAAYSWIALFLF